jgi:hypothetical protein
VERVFQEGKFNSIKMEVSKDVQNAWRRKEEQNEE